MHCEFFLLSIFEKIKSQPFSFKKIVLIVHITICVFIQGHSSFVTHLDWSTNSQYIVTNSGDYEILYCELLCQSGLYTGILNGDYIWFSNSNNLSLKGEASTGKHITSAEVVRNLEWATSTCVLGFGVFGESCHSIMS